MDKLTVQLKEKNYDIIIQNGSFNDFGKSIRQIYSGDNITIITDENLYDIYGVDFESNLISQGFHPNFIVIKPGENSKSIGMLQYVYEKLVQFKVTRGDLIVAFGGGVVGDLTGFAAATYLRGVQYIQIPTSLLAQVDSSIGGKVAVNLNEGKNLIGNFYHPKKVLIDPQLLETLPERFLKDGMGEVIKYACIQDEKLFSLLESIKNRCNLMENIDCIIYTCCNIKRKIVEEDEKDLGLRMILNFGHTMGHCIEKYFDYEKYSHGEAVAMGMYYISKNSERLSLTKEGTSEKIKRILQNYNIEFELPHMDFTRVREIASLDKKNISGSLNIILLKKIGECYTKKIRIEELSKLF